MSIVGITMGCPAGVGPEILLRFFARRDWPAHVRPVVLGDSGILQKCSDDLSLSADCKAWQPGTPVPDTGIPVINLSSLNVADHSWGVPTPPCGTAMAEYIHAAVRLIQDGYLDAMTTCPISKKSLQQAGYSYPGHTEMLVALTASKRYTMMMAGASLKVTLATIHCPLSSVSSRLSISGISELIDITNEALQVDFGLSSPRIAVAGLNPHSGEQGLFGNEESEIIEPAVRQSMTAGIDVSGPFPPDTVFFKAASGEFDAVVCMYHDQGLIPFKLLHFKDGVNVTLGLPIVRTSVDHGTAYDIAGKGLAQADSLSSAVSMAALISYNRQQHTR